MAECVVPIDFTDEERAALIDLLVGIIEQNPFPRGILTKLRPAPELPPEDPYEIDDELPGLRETGY